MERGTMTPSPNRVRRFAAFTALALSANVAILATSSHDNSADAATLRSWNAQVQRIVDGDTVEVTIGSDATIVSIRIAGLQTNEVHYDDPDLDPECHSAEATARLTELLDDRNVELLARSASSASLGRPIRHVFVGGRNVAEIMLREGLGVPVAFNEEPDFAAEITNQALLAAREGIGVWNDDACGSGPAQNAALDIVTNYDAAGDDNANINGEYVQLRNRGSQTVGLDGWTMRDTALRRFQLPSGYRIAPGGRLMIHVGKGTNTSDKIFLNQTASILGNDVDGVFLHDADFDIRAYDMWPCSQTCPKPEAVSIATVNYDAEGDDMLNPNGEYIRLRNDGNTTIDFQDWMIEIPPLQLTSIGSRLIAPGKSLTIYVGRGTNTTSKMFWQLDAPILNNAQHLVLLYNPDRAIVDCDSRGPLICPEVQQEGSDSLTIPGPASGYRPAVRSR